MCREKSDKRQLTRLVRTADGVILDPTGKQPGRGAYLCEQDACWERALRSNALERALRTSLTESEREALAAARPLLTEDETV